MGSGPPRRRREQHPDQQSGGEHTNGEPLRRTLWEANAVARWYAIRTSTGYDLPRKTLQVTYEVSLPLLDRATATGSASRNRDVAEADQYVERRTDCLVQPDQLPYRWEASLKRFGLMLDPVSQRFPFASMNEITASASAGSTTWDTAAFCSSVPICLGANSPAPSRNWMKTLPPEGASRSGLTIFS